MFSWLINKISGNYNETQIKSLLPLVQQINTLCDEYDSLSDDEIKAKSAALKQIVSQIELPTKIKDLK